MRPDTADSYHQRIARVLQHIQNHLDAPLRLEELAQVAHFSPFHFHRVFRGMVGESVKEHVRRLRLERAAQSLKNSGLPVLDIALEAGYEAHESFTRAFADMFGMPPSEFRKNHTAGVQARRPATAAQAPASGFRMQKLEHLRAVYVRHIGPYEAVGQAWDKLMTWAGRRGLLGPAIRLLGIVHDDPEITPPDKLRYDAALAVDGAIEPAGEIGIQEIPGGEYAVALHVGPYSGLYEVYAALCGGWLPQMGRELRSAPALEFYFNSPAMTPPEELRTEIWLPLVTEHA